MSKNTRGEKEYTRLQELIHENGRMKREISSLRKQLARLDLDRHAFVKDIIDEHISRENAEESATKVLSKLKESWRCRECGVGYLEIVIYNKVNETWYYRQCNNCEHRTKSQVYQSDKVQGLVKNSVTKRKY